MPRKRQQPTLRTSPTPCRECGTPNFSVYFTEPTHTRLLHTSTCHTCDFWLNLVEQHDDLQIARVAGTQYVVKPNKPNPPYPSHLGHGGATFRIRWHDDRPSVVSNNVWCQGDIPPAFKERLPDNADFLAPCTAAIRSSFDGDTLSYELTITCDTTSSELYRMFHWSTNSAIEEAARWCAVWPNGTPTLSHIPQARTR